MASRALDRMSDGHWRRLSSLDLAERHFENHPGVGEVIVETAPPRVFRRGGGKNADLRGMHGYPATVEDVAAFLVAIGPQFQVGKVIPEAHQLGVYTVAAHSVTSACLTILPVTVALCGRSCALRSDLWRQYRWCRPRSGLNRYEKRE